MITRRGIVGLMAGTAIALSLGGCDFLNYNFLRYKMIVEVETPQGVKIGSSVREMGLGKRRQIVGVSVKFRGEAVIVDLPGGQTLFALLTGGDGDPDYAKMLGGRAEVWGKSPSEPRKGPVELYPKAPDTIGLKHTNPLPMLVRFRDLADPTSVERVDPNDLAASFGPGVRLKRIAIEASDDVVTNGIEKRLIWLPSHYDKYLSGDRYQSIENKYKGISAIIGAASFSVGSGLSPYGKKN